MNSFALTDEGDISLTNGVIQQNTDLYTLKDLINTRLSTILGELDNYNEGVDYYNIIFAQTPISMKVSELSRVILATDYVQSVTLEEVTQDRQTKAYTFRFYIKSTLGDLTIDKEIANA